MNLFRKISVLGIDDCDIVQAIYKEMFRRTILSDFSYTGIDGLHAFNGIKANDYDIVLLDWNFNDVFNGGDIEKHLLEKKGYQGHIIFVTADIDAHNTLTKLDKHSILKPFNWEDLNQVCLDVFYGKEKHIIKQRIESASKFDIIIPSVIL